MELMNPRPTAMSQISEWGLIVTQTRQNLGFHPVLETSADPSMRHSGHDRLRHFTREAVLDQLPDEVPAGSTQTLRATFTRSPITPPLFGERNQLLCSGLDVQLRIFDGDGAPARASWEVTERTAQGASEHENAAVVLAGVLDAAHEFLRRNRTARLELHLPDRLLRIFGPGDLGRLSLLVAEDPDPQVANLRHAATTRWLDELKSVGLERRSSLLEQAKTQGKQAPIPHRTEVTYATDASVHAWPSRYGKARAAWIREDGRFFISPPQATINVLAVELRAILAALVHAGTDEHVRVITDNMDAVDFLAPASRKSLVDHPLVVKAAVASIRQRMASFQVRPLVEHVRGHCGHPLNEAADGLARNARIAGETDLPFAADLVARACSDYADLRRAAAPDPSAAVIPQMSARMPGLRARARVCKALAVLETAH